MREPRALTIEEIRTIEDKYAAAAVRAQKAGFDGVELHACGYYMGQQFSVLHRQYKNRRVRRKPGEQKPVLYEYYRENQEACGTDFGLVVKQAVMEAGEQGGITMEEGCSTPISS